MRPVLASVLAIACFSGATPAQNIASVLQIGDERDNYTFFRPTDLAVDAAGRIAVLDGGDRKVRVYSPQGVFLYSFGGEGGGPGEFIMPVRVVAVAEGWEVFDPRQDRQSRFNARGAHVETRTLPTPAGLAVSIVLPLRHGWSFAQTIYRASPGAPSHDPHVRAILFSSGPNARADTLATFPQGYAIWHVPGRAAPWGVLPLPWMGAGGALAAAGDSLLLIADGATGLVTFQRITASGPVPAGSVDQMRRARPAPTSRLNAIQDSMRRVLSNREIRLIVPSTVFAFTGAAFFDNAGNAWVELTSDDGQPAWSRIVRATGAITTVRLPAPFRLKAVQNDLLYGFWADELDVQTVRVYRLR